MKLRDIVESLSGSKHVIRDTGRILGDLIQFIYNNGASEELKELDHFLKTPNQKDWPKWIVNSTIKKALEINDPELTQKSENWAELNNLTPQTIAAAVYDMDEKFTKGTPLQQTSLSRQVRTKAKRALGQQGFVSTLSNASTIQKSRIKKMLTNIAQDSDKIIKANKKDLPSQDLSN